MENHLMTNITTKLFAATIAVALLNAVPASAQQPQVSRIRGTIESVDGSTLTVKSRDGSELKLHTPDNVGVTGIAKIALSDIKSGAYIGVAAMPQEDGTQKALSVHLFPEAMRGTAEGFRPWDLRPNSTMTNASVDQMVTANDGNKLTLKYKDGEKTIIVPPETPIVSLVQGDKSELKAGAKIIAFVSKKDDGSYDAPRFFVGRDGLTPPM
jgi:hypothetical protein